MIPINPRPTAPQPNGWSLEFLHKDRWLPEITPETYREARAEAKRRFGVGISIWRIRPYWGEVTATENGGGDEVIKHAVSNPPQLSEKEIVAEVYDYYMQLAKTNSLLLQALAKHWPKDSVAFYKLQAEQLNALCADPFAPVLITTTPQLP